MTTRPLVWRLKSIEDCSYMPMCVCSTSRTNLRSSGEHRPVAGCSGASPCAKLGKGQVRVRNESHLLLWGWLYILEIGLCYSPRVVSQPDHPDLKLLRLVTRLGTISEPKAKSLLHATLLQ